MVEKAQFDYQAVFKRLDKLLIKLGVNPETIKPMTSEQINNRLDSLIDRLNKLEVV